MFENFENFKNRKTPAWVVGLVAVAVGAHVAFGAGLVVKDMWAAPLLDVPVVDDDLKIGTAPPPPPPPPAGGKKLDVQKKVEPKKVKVTETVQPTKVEDKPPEVATDAGGEGGVEGGEQGGVEGGEIGGQVGGVVGAPPAPPPPPPPPPPPAPPPNVAPQAFEAQRISGEKQILPDDVTKTEIQRAGKTQFMVPVKVCVATNGAVSDVRMLKSSDLPAYDQKLNREIRKWRYTPFTVNGMPAPACGMVNFAYRQK